MNGSQGGKQKRGLGTDEWKLGMNEQDEIWEPEERREEESKNRKGVEEKRDGTDTASL